MRFKRIILVVLSMSVAGAMVAVPPAQARWAYGTGPTGLDVDGYGTSGSLVCTDRVIGRTGLSSEDPDPGSFVPPPGPYGTQEIEVFVSDVSFLDAHGEAGGIRMADGALLPAVASDLSEELQLLDPIETYQFTGIGLVYAAGGFSVTIPSGAADVGDHVAVRKAGNSLFTSFRAIDCDSPPPALRVTTSPAVAAEIEVDGFARDLWGLNWVPFPPGEHEVCFGEVPGFVAPPCQTATIPWDGGGTVAITGTYQPSAYIRATTSPAVASTISIRRQTRNDWGAWVEVAPGTHEVCFGEVAGHIPPACRDLTVAAGETAETTGSFARDPFASGPTGPYGLLRVTTSPPVNGLISVDGVPRHPWGLNWMKISTGSHEVCFGAVPNFTEPDCRTVTVSAGQTRTTVGTYTPMGFLRVLTDPPVNATVGLSLTALNNYGAWVAKKPGSYFVCFNHVNGYQEPPCQSATVTGGVTTTVTGHYEPLT